MTNEEIKRRYLNSAQKTKQIGILAELNACDTDKIKTILKEQGIVLKTRGAAKKKEPAEKKRELAAEIQEGLPEEMEKEKAAPKPTPIFSSKTTYPVLSDAMRAILHEAADRHLSEAKAQLRIVEEINDFLDSFKNEQSIS